MATYFKCEPQMDSRWWKGQSEQRQRITQHRIYNPELPSDYSDPVPTTPVPNPPSLGLLKTESFYVSGTEHEQSGSSYTGTIIIGSLMVIAGFLGSKLYNYNN